ncbi:MAG: hypothetical protein ACRDMJ_00340 [Solirubrobacteraceae bacterium]
MSWILGARARARMNVSRPGARVEYSSVLALLGALLGAALLVAAELSPLLTVRSAAAIHDRVLTTVTGGSNHDWALLPIAALAVGWSVVSRRLARGGSARAGRAPAVPARWSWLVFAVLGAAALAIALGHDLPDARATGLIGHAGVSYTAAAASPAVGFYLETLGGVVLLLVAAGGLLLRPQAVSGSGKGPGRAAVGKRSADSGPRRSAS